MIERRYDEWAGNPKGTPEDKENCIETVRDSTGWHFNQCSRKRGYGPNGEYCKQHAQKLLLRTQLTFEKILNRDEIGNLGVSNNSSSIAVKRKTEEDAK